MKPIVSRPLLVGVVAVGLFLGWSPVTAWAEHPLPVTKESSKELRQVVQKVLPAVVSLTSKSKPTGKSTDEKLRKLKEFLEEHPELRPLFDRVNPDDIPDRPEGFGSGVIIDGKRGVILTNNHVVEGANLVVVTMQDGREFETTDIIRDPKADVAIVRLKPEDARSAELPSAELGDSSEVEIGDWVLAMGSPFQLQGTVTSGIVSAKGRAPAELDLLYKDFIQTDAAINPGNSGGPLVSLDGKVIGINTAIRSSTGSFNGIGFAIPSAMIKPIAAQLDKEGKVKRGYLGVSMMSTTPKLRKEKAIPSGVVITQLTSKDAPAAKAGLKPDDIVLSVNGQPVSDTRELQAVVTATPAGATVKMKVFRDGNIVEVPVTIEEQPESFGARSFVSRRPSPEGDELKDLGMTVAQMNRGIVVLEVAEDGRAAKQGIQPGDRILKAEKMEVKTLGELKEAIKGVNVAKEGVMLKVLGRDGEERLVVLGGEER